MTVATVWLLDANLLIALTHAAHVHHGVAQDWFAAVPKRRFATCTLTQLAYVRLSSNPRVAGAEISPARALQALRELCAHSGHVFWPGEALPLDMPSLNTPALVGHRQVTDAYLLGLAAAQGQKLATLDRGLLAFAQATQLAAHLEWVGTPLAAHEPRPRYRAKKP